MLKYRKTHELRVAFGFSGRMEDEMEAYRGFKEIADEEGWQLWTLHENFETQLRRLLERDLVDAVVGAFISLRWVESLPEKLIKIHRGFHPPGGSLSSVSLDMEQVLEQVTTHFREMGYSRTRVFSPRRIGTLPWVRSADSLREILQQESSAAFFCPSDYLARQGIQVARSLGAKVPEDFGFAGLGDRRLDRLLAEVEITSVPEPHAEIGRQAAALLKEQLAGDAPRQCRVKAGRLIPRESSRRESFRSSLRARVEELLLPVLATPPPAADWAGSMGMSRRAFETAFSRETGKTPYAYFLELRVNEARRLLSETDWTIARVGQAVGIPDPPRFSAFFRTQTGSTPSDWRRNRA